MQPATPEDDLARRDPIAEFQAIADELRSNETFDLLLESALVAVNRVKILAHDLPRVVQFAEVVERGAFNPRNPEAHTPTAVGTNLRPDDDVLAMDATIPRAPEPEESEE